MVAGVALSAAQVGASLSVLGVSTSFDLHGKPLRGLDFQTLFSPSGRRVVTQAALSALNDPDPSTLACEGFSDDGRMLGLEITMENGRVQQANYNNYPILRMAHAPEVEPHFIQSEFSPTGLGEPGLPAG